MTAQFLEKKNVFFKLLFALSAFFTLSLAGAKKADALDLAANTEIVKKFVEPQPKTKYFMWTAKQWIPETKETLWAPLRADNFFYPLERTSKMKITLLPTKQKDVYQIQLPGNYFYVDDSKPYVRYPTVAYAPEQRYYLLGQRPKQSNLRASWQFIPVPGCEGSYRIRNMATGRYLSVDIWDCSEIGSPLRLIVDDYKPEEANVIHSFSFTK